MFADKDFFYFSSLIFNDNHVLVELHKPFKRNCDCQEKTKWYWYRWHCKLRGFTKNSVNPWRMWGS